MGRIPDIIELGWVYRRLWNTGNDILRKFPLFGYSLFDIFFGAWMALYSICFVARYHRSPAMERYLCVNRSDAHVCPYG